MHGVVLSWVARLASLALVRELKDTYFSLPFITELRCLKITALLQYLPTSDLQDGSFSVLSPPSGHPRRRYVQHGSTATVFAGEQPVGLPDPPMTTHPLPPLAPRGSNQSVTRRHSIILC
jgi:hypothetical protein